MTINKYTANTIQNIKANNVYTEPTNPLYSLNNTGGTNINITMNTNANMLNFLIKSTLGCFAHSQPIFSNFNTYVYVKPNNTNINKLIKTIYLYHEYIK